MGGSLQGRRFRAREDTSRRGRRGEASLEGGQAAIKANSALQRNSSRCFFFASAFACVHMSGLLVQPRLLAKMVSAGRRSRQSSGSGLDRLLLCAVYPPLPIERSRPSLSVSCKVGASGFKQCPRAPISSGGCDSPAGAYVALAISFPAIRAILLASATAASLGALRSNSAVSQPDGLFAAPRRVCQITAAAPCRRSNARAAMRVRRLHHRERGDQPADAGDRRQAPGGDEAKLRPMTADRVHELRALARPAARAGPPASEPHV